MIKNVEVVNSKMILLDDIIIRGIGIRRTISMSNTMKITASRKNRVENGIRAEFIGSNPHSNGDVFSRSFDDRIYRILANTRITNGTKMHNEEEINMYVIN